MTTITNNQEETGTIKDYLTKVVQHVILVKEMAKGYVGLEYINSKNWRSALDYKTNRMVLNQIVLDGLFTKAVIESFYHSEGLRGIWEIADQEQMEI